MNDATFKTGKYTVKLSSGAAQLYRTDEEGAESWIGSAADLELATTIIEGLILVETKRFYYPESTPSFKPESMGRSLPYLAKG